uniref:Uncharacterized protein n=1 Tax=Arundo donax TaxID=35708 RepID=A0A0A9GLZ5_ARUDO
MFPLSPLSSCPHRPDELPPLIHHPFHNNLCRPIIHARRQYNASRVPLTSPHASVPPVSPTCVRVFQRFDWSQSSVASSSVTVCSRALRISSVPK